MLLLAAFTFGKLLGGPKLLPNTSPNTTRAGALGALVATAALDAALAALGLVPAGRAPPGERPMADRARGAVRLVRRQAAACVAQAVLLTVAAALGAVLS